MTYSAIAQLELPFGVTLAPAAGALEIALRMLVAAAAGTIVAYVYRRSRPQPRERLAEFTITLMLLTMLVALTTVVIGDSVARAFGLVGALSIVRFRTVVEDTRDTAFVIYAVATGMAAGAGAFAACAIGTPAIGLLAIHLHMRFPTVAVPGPTSHRLLVRVNAGIDAATLASDSLNRHARRFALVSLATARQGAATDARFDIDLAQPEDASALFDALSRLEGVAQVEIEPRA
jgi:Domain of unknown function (DUF4956)